MLTYHEDFPDTIDREKITQNIKVFSLESFGILYSLLKYKSGEGKQNTKKYSFPQSPTAQNSNRAPTAANTALSF